MEIERGIMTERNHMSLQKAGKGVLFLLAFWLMVMSGLNVLHVSAASKKIALNKTSVILEAKKTCSLELLNASGTVTWASSDKTVATVTSAGKITAKAAGTCRIAAKYNNKKYYCTVTVVSLSKKSAALEVGETCKLTLEGISEKVQWRTTDLSVASISSTGKITAKKAGTCKVYAKYNDKRYYCTVTVNKKAVLNRTSVNMLKKRTCQLQLTNAVGTVTWKSSDSTVATVSSDGKITTKATGTCRIIARYRNKNYICTVTVYNTNAEWMPAALKEKYKVSSNKGKIVLAGSSTMAYWSNAASMLAPLEVINMGIPGSTVEDWLELYPSLITKYKPEAVVLYLGSNNITGSASSMTGEQTGALLKKLLTKLRKAMPDTTIYYISIQPTIRRWSVWSEAKTSNSIVKKFCSTQENMYYIDTTKYLLGSDGLPNAAYLRADNLHLNATGYKVWEKYVAARIKKDLL